MPDMQHIRAWGRWRKGPPAEHDPNIAEAQAILKRLDDRHLYKMCHEVLVPDRWALKKNASCLLRIHGLYQTPDWPTSVDDVIAHFITESACLHMRSRHCTGIP